MRELFPLILLKRFQIRDYRNKQSFENSSRFFLYIQNIEN